MLDGITLPSVYQYSVVADKMSKLAVVGQQTLTDTSYSLSYNDYERKTFMSFGKSLNGLKYTDLKSDTITILITAYDKFKNTIAKYLKILN